MKKYYISPVEIHELIKKGKTYTQIAKMCGLSRQWIYQVRTNSQYKFTRKRINTNLITGWSGIDNYIKQCQNSERNHERTKTQERTQ